jgi:hypothetical protein
LEDAGQFDRGRSPSVSVIQIPQELIELRASLSQFLDREVRPTEVAYRQDILDGRFDFVKEERRKLSTELASRSPPRRWVSPTTSSGG